MNFFFSLINRAQPYWAASKSYLLPLMMVGLIFLGPAVCKVVARMTYSCRPWFIKLCGLLAAVGAMIAGNWVFHQCAGRAFIWYVWLPDVLFLVNMIGWLFTPMVHLRAGSADALDSKIERHRPRGWNALIARWIPATGEHRVLLTKR
jgi:hypothetical protein